MAFNASTYEVNAASSSVKIVAGRWAGGGANANMVKTAGVGVVSVATDAGGGDGDYIVTFNNVGATLLGLYFNVESAGNTAGQRIVNTKKATYSATAKTVSIYITDVATPTGKDLATDEYLNIIAVWSDSSVP